MTLLPPGSPDRLFSALGARVSGTHRGGTDSVIAQSCENGRVSAAGVDRFPTAPADLTPEWFSEALGQRFTGVRLETVGEGVGFLGQTVRAHLTSDGAEPVALIVKFVAEGPARAVASSMGLYEREVRFYDEVASQVGIAVPRCSFAEIDLESGLFALVLDDLAPARAGDQLIGASDEEIAAAVATAARLHATWWDSADLDAWAWLPSQTALISGFVERAPELYPAFAEAWSDEFSDDELKLGEKVTLHLEHLMAAVDHPPFTLVHGDYRLDNLFFSDDGEVVVIDWQLPFRGFSGALDFALLVASSLMPEDRNRLMPTLEALYLDELASAGVAKFGIDEFRPALAAAAGQLLSRCPVAHQIPSPNERASTMRARMFRGYFDIAEHAGLGELL